MNNEGELLKLMTYNIHSGKDLEGKYTFTQMIDFIEKYSPDILAIQEINENKKRGFQTREIKEKLRLNIHFGPHVAIGRGQYGIATASPFEIIRKHHIIFPSMGERRGMIHTQLKTKHRIVHVLNTHLGLNKLERERQFHIIQKYVEDIQGPVVLMGDLNTMELPLGPPLLFDANQRQDDDSPTLINTDKRIDYIMLSPNIQSIKYKVAPIYFSDHFPVVAEIII